MIYCESCGNRLADSAKFCPECGARVTVRPAQEPGDLPPGRGLDPGDLPSRRAPDPAGLPPRYVAPEPMDLSSQPPLETGNPPAEDIGGLPDRASPSASQRIDVPERSPATAARAIYDLADLRPEQPPATAREMSEVEAAPRPKVPSYKRVEPASSKILQGDPIYMVQAAFDIYMRELCAGFGYQQRPSTDSERGGSEYIFERDGKTMVMRLELNTGSVGPGEEAVQKAHEAQTHYGANEAVVVTNRFFEDDAREAAQRLGVELWDVLTLRKLRSELLGGSA